jgi:hypothetical protein
MRYMSEPSNLCHRTNQPQLSCSKCKYVYCQVSVGALLPTPGGMDLEKLIQRHELTI